LSARGTAVARAPFARSGEAVSHTRVGMARRWRPAGVDIHGLLLDRRDRLFAFERRRGAARLPESTGNLRDFGQQRGARRPC